jgi:hypothetical protein
MEEPAVDLAGLQRRLLLGGRRLVELEAHTGKLAVEVPQDVRKHGCHGETRERHPQASHPALGHRLHVGRHLLERRQYRLGASQQRSACRRKLDLAARAVEESDSQRLLQLGDLAGECGLGDGERLGRLPEMQAPRHLPEVHQVPQLERVLILPRHR